MSSSPMQTTDHISDDNMSTKTDKTDNDVGDDAAKGALCFDKKETEGARWQSDLLPVDCDVECELNSNLISDHIFHHQTTGSCNSADPLDSELSPCKTSKRKCLSTSRNEPTPETPTIVGKGEIPHRLRTSATTCETEDKLMRVDCNGTSRRERMSGCSSSDRTVDAVDRLSESPVSNVLWRLHSFVATLGGRSTADPPAHQKEDVAKKFVAGPTSLTANTFHDQTARFPCNRGICSEIKSGAKRPNVPSSCSRNGNTQRYQGQHLASDHTSRNTVFDRPRNASESLSLLGSFKNGFPEQEQPLDLSLHRHDKAKARTPTGVTPESSSLCKQSTVLQQCLPLPPYSATASNKVLNHARPPMHTFRYPPAQVHLDRIRHASVRSNKCHAKSTDPNPRRCSVTIQPQDKRQPQSSHHKSSFSSKGDRAHRRGGVKDINRQSSGHKGQHIPRKQWSASKPLSPAGRHCHSQYQCNCGAAFETLYEQAVHMEATGHCPSRKEPSVTETFEYQKLVRGQDLWLNYGSEQAREILRCMRCQRSFESLSELTLHMIRTKHYEEIVGSHGSNAFVGETTTRERQKQNLIVVSNEAASVSQSHLAVNGTNRARRVDSTRIEKRKQREMDQEQEKCKVPCISMQSNQREVTMNDIEFTKSEEVGAATSLTNSGKTRSLCSAVFETDSKHIEMEGHGMVENGPFESQSTNDEAILKIIDDDTVKVIDDDTVKVIDDVTVKVTLKVIADVIRQIEDDDTIELTDETILKVTDDATMKITEDTIMHSTNGNPLKVNEDAIITVIEDATIKVIDDATKKVTADATIKVTSDITVKLTDDATLEVPDTNLVVTDNAVMEVTEDVTLQVERATDEVTTGAILKVTEYTSVLDIETLSVTGVNNGSSNDELAMQKIVAIDTNRNNDETNSINNEISENNNEPIGNNSELIGNNDESNSNNNYSNGNNDVTNDDTYETTGKNDVSNDDNNEANDNEILSKAVVAIDFHETDPSSNDRSRSSVCSRQIDCRKRKDITSGATNQLFTDSDEFKVPTPKKPRRSPVTFEAESCTSGLKGGQQPTIDVCNKSVRPSNRSSTTCVHLSSGYSLAVSPVATDYLRLRSRRQTRFSGYIANSSSAVTGSETLCASPESNPNRLDADFRTENTASAIDAMQQFIDKSFSASCDLSESEPYKCKSRSETHRETPLVPSSASCASQASSTGWIQGARNKREEERCQPLHNGSSRAEHLDDTSAFKRNKKHLFNREFRRWRDSEFIDSGGASKSNKVKSRTNYCHDTLLADSNDYRSSKVDAADDQMRAVSAAATTPQDIDHANPAVPLQEVKDDARTDYSQGSSFPAEFTARDDDRFSEFEDNRYLSSSAPPSIRPVPSDGSLDSVAPEPRSASCEVYKPGEKESSEGCQDLVCRGTGFQDLDGVSCPPTVKYRNLDNCLNSGCKCKQLPESAQVQNRRKATRTSYKGSDDSRENQRPRGSHDRNQSSSIKDLIKTSPYVYLPLDHSAMFTKYGTSSWPTKETRTSNKCRSQNPSLSRSQTSFETQMLGSMSPKLDSANERKITTGANFTGENEGR